MNTLIDIDNILDRLVAEEKVPGISVTVLHEEETVFQRGYGFANIEAKVPVHPEQTIFRVASVSKPIAATALAQLVAEGQIDLDASFYEYVPYYPKKEWDFTIRQLAGHTAGIRGYRGFEFGLSKPYTIRESIAIFKDDKLLFEPGTNYFYTSFDWVLISLAMEEVVGYPFSEYVKAKVLKPLDMQKTFDPKGYLEYCDGKPKKYHTNFYSKGRKGFRSAMKVDNSYKLAGGGYLSTSNDIAKLGLAYFQGRLFDKELAPQFLTSQVVKGKPTLYGLGWQVSRDALGRSFFGHVGNGVGGHSNFFIYPDRKMVIVILVNCTEPKIEEELLQVRNLFLSLHESH